MQDRYKTFELLVHHVAAKEKCNKEFEAFKKCDTKNETGFYDGYRPHCLSKAHEVISVFCLFLDIIADLENLGRIFLFISFCFLFF